MKQNGNALIYVLIAIALMGALTISLTSSSSTQSVSPQKIAQVVSTLKSQVQTIQTAIMECVLVYPGGDTNEPAAQKNRPYPLNPSDNYLDTPDVDDNVENIRCPGNPGDSNDHTDIWLSSGGKFMPPTPDLFTDWEYYNDDDGVFFFTTTTFSDAYLTTALDKLDSQFGECEVDVITSGGSATDISSDTTARECPANTTCFRYWIIRKSSSLPACP